MRYLTWITTALWVPLELHIVRHSSSAYVTQLAFLVVERHCIPRSCGYAQGHGSHCSEPARATSFVHVRKWPVRSPGAANPHTRAYTSPSWGSRMDALCSRCFSLHPVASGRNLTMLSIVSCIFVVSCISQMPPRKKTIGREAKGTQGERAKPNTSKKRSRQSPSDNSKPSPTAPLQPPPRKQKAGQEEPVDEWVMPSLSDDPAKAKRKIEKMLREIQELKAQDGQQQNNRTRVLSHGERRKVAHEHRLVDVLKRLLAAETASGQATPTGEQQDAREVSMGSGSSHRTRSSTAASPLSAASSSDAPPPPNLCHAAASAREAYYSSPHTDEHPRFQPPVTRHAEAAAQADLQDRMGNLKPGGRIQRTMRRSAEEQHEWTMEQQRRRRAETKLRSGIFENLMSMLMRYDIPLVQLLMAEFALQPCNAGTWGQMRTRFLALYARTCHTIHAPSADGRRPSWRS